jgi:hypothetical protein
MNLPLISSLHSCYEYRSFEKVMLKLISDRYAENVNLRMTQPLLNTRSSCMASPLDYIF